MKRSGNLLITNDKYITELLEHPQYKITPNGIVLTIITKTGKISRNGVWRVAGHLKNGYWEVKFKDKALRRSRIIYAKFNGKLENDLVINHIDGNKRNDNPKNLELITVSENNFHRFRTLGCKPVIGNYILDYDIADQIRKEHKIGKSYKELCNKFGISKGHVSEIINNKIWVR